MGRPRKYTLEELEAIRENWLSTCAEQKRLITKGNFCLFAKISRETWNEWQKEGHEFADTIKEIEGFIEDAWVQRLAGNSVAGAIFYLKNAFKESYKDRYDTDITSGGEKIVPIYAGKSLQRHDSDAEDIQSEKKD